MMLKLATNPGASLPAMLGNDAELQGAYRLLNNEAVDFDALCDPYFEAAAARGIEAGDVLVLHDTTDCSFPHLDPKDVGYLQTGKAGFFVHTSLVVDAMRWRRPLGVIHAEPIIRTKPNRGKGKRSGAKSAFDGDKEFSRWWTGVEASADRLEGCKNVKHVMDREGDSYELMSQMLDSERRFVIRVRVDRRGRDAKDGDGPWSTIRQVAEGCGGILEREVALSRRAAKSAPVANKRHAPRKMRMARLRFAATSVVIPCPQYLKKRAPRQLELGLVHVSEIDPPAGQEPVEWLLYTTEAVTTAEEVTAVVDTYRARWLIEEYFGALKGGCVFEEREFESRHALLNMLAMSLPVATELLALRSRSRQEPSAPATDVLSSVQLDVLRHFSSRKLPENPTVEDALLSVAALGGHLKRNGPPGWKVLHRGMAKLLDYEAGWIAGLRSRKK